MAIAPEGTRKKVDAWKTGFYYIAKKANVPILMFTLDLKIKKINFQSLFTQQMMLKPILSLCELFMMG